MQRLVREYDYLIVPTAQIFPFDIDETWPHQIAGQTMRTYHEWMKAICLVTMSGCPALAVPAGLRPQGLPMGLQIIAPVHHEMDCLKLAAAYEAANRTERGAAAAAPERPLGRAAPRRDRPDLHHHTSPSTTKYPVVQIYRGRIAVAAASSVTRAPSPVCRPSSLDQRAMLVPRDQA